jgi:hypothetical protein
MSYKHIMMDDKSYLDEQSSSFIRLQTLDFFNFERVIPILHSVVSGNCE